MRENEEQAMIEEHDIDHDAEDNAASTMVHGLREPDNDISCR